MKVLIHAGNSGSGGYVQYLRGVLATAPPAGVEVDVLCSPSMARRLGDVDPAVRLLVEPALDAATRASRLAWWYRDYRALLAKANPDVVYQPTGVVQGRRGRAALVVGNRNVAPFDAESYRLYGLSRQSLSFLFWRMRLLRGMRRADGIHFLSRHARDLVLRQVGRSGQGKPNVVVPNGVPRELLGVPAVARAEPGPVVRVLCVSTLWLTKYQWNVLAAVCTLRVHTGLDVRVTFVGGGEPRARERLWQEIHQRSAEDFVTVVEDASPEQVRDFYRQADVFVFPSAQENFPVTLLEAMACGLPILCSNRMVMPSVLRDAGRYFDPTSPEELANALGELVVDGELRVACGKRAQEYSRAYTWEATAAALYDFLCEVVFLCEAAAVPARSARAAARRDAPLRWR